MCLSIIKSDTKRHTATSPIAVYKVIDAVNNRSPFQGFMYEPNEQVKVRMRKDTKKDYVVDSHNFRPNQVSIGFHAFRSLRGATAFSRSDEKVALMTIPEGAHYYIGDADDIVSDTLDTGTLERTKRSD